MQALGLGDKIRIMRKAKKKTQCELAVLLETNQGYISRIENSDCTGRVSTIRDIASVLGFDLVITFKPKQNVLRK
jgi:transcriptional regulator with XRE-family HTH domain